MLSTKEIENSARKHKAPGAKMKMERPATVAQVLYRATAGHKINCKQVPRPKLLAQTIQNNMKSNKSSRKRHLNPTIP